MLASRTLTPSSAGDGRRWHGLQLAIAVVAAYGLSAALGLPENLWTVMSALIVVRPNTGASLGAGWSRLGGTVMGSACGIAGVWLRHHGAPLPVITPPVATLGIVAVLAFASATVPLLNSAPIAALIILSSSGMPGHSAMQVALLRGAEVGIGVLTGLAVSLLLRSARASSRFGDECASLLDRFAQQLQPSGLAAAETDLRTPLRQLATLAAHADLETKLFRHPSASREKENLQSHTRLARLTARIYQDTAVLGRLLEGAQGDGLQACREDAAENAAQALRASAAALRQHALVDLSALGAATGRLLVAERPAVTLTGPLGLLQEDLRMLTRLAFKTTRATRPLQAPPAR
jgi:uncharacterized membrane protein YccC